METRQLSIIIPFLNEEEVLPLLRARFEQVKGMPKNWELVMVSDGSTDGSIPFVEEWSAEDSRVRLIVLSRNFGHQAAVTAGLNHVAGDFVAIMDADLQDEPEVMLQLLQTARTGGYDVVYATREKRRSALWKRCAYSAFYWLYGKLADTPVHLDSGDFCVLSRRAVESLNSLPERVRFVRGLRSWIGLRTTSVGVHRPERAGGQTQYSLFKLIKLAMTGIDLLFDQTPTSCDRCGIPSLYRSDQPGRILPDPGSGLRPPQRGAWIRHSCHPLALPQRRHDAPAGNRR